MLNYLYLKMMYRRIDFFFLQIRRRRKGPVPNLGNIKRMAYSFEKLYDIVVVLLQTFNPGKVLK